MRDTVEFPRSRQYLEEPSSGTSWAPGHLLSSHLDWYVEFVIIEKLALANFEPVSLSCFRTLVGQGRPTRARCVLLCQHHDEAF
jgi:hypothetical protein